MNRSQRIIVVIALGVGLSVLVDTFNALSLSGAGWFGYAPGTNPVFSADFVDRSRGDSVIGALVWLVGIAVWALVSMRILRERADSSR